MKIDGTKSHPRKGKIWKVIIICIPILVICMYYLASWIFLVPVAHRYILHWWDEKTEGPPGTWEAEHRMYLESLEAPRLTAKEVAELLRKEKVVKTQELYDMVNWYVNEGDENVIRQVIANRRYEMKVILPEEREDKSSTIVCHASGQYLVPLWNTEAITRIYHYELHRYAATRGTDPHFIYFLMCNMPVNDRRSWFFEQVFHDDILTYLRIYVKYKSWPTIRSLAKENIVDYRCGWLDFATIEEVLKLADEKGAEPAYALYMQRYRDNYRRFSGQLNDCNNWGKKYRYESICRGWSSDKVQCVIRVYNVEPNGAIIGIRNIRGAASVVVAGEDITKLCSLTKENVLQIPLQAGDKIEITLELKVTPGWWKAYKGLY